MDLNPTSYFPIYPSSEIFSYSSTNNYSSYYPSIDITLDRSNTRSDYCLICNDRSSGIHFGVSTCEACKAFFRRTNLSIYSIPPPCSPNRCEINIKNRNNCPSCRFDKCKRLGMDRDNVIYGKPSKQQHSSIYQQDYFLEQIIHILNELRKIFQQIYSIHNKQQIDRFGQIIFQLFYQQTSEIYNSDVIHRIFNIIYENNILSDNYLNLRLILCLWLFVYYYETYFFKQKISHDKLMILIKLLDMELNQYQLKQTFFRIEFLNIFTKFTDLIQEIYLDN